MQELRQQNMEHNWGGPYTTLQLTHQVLEQTTITHTHT